MDFMKGIRSAYNAYSFSCINAGAFGAPCFDNSGCLSGLACDNRSSGARPYTCSHLIGSKCSSFSDCANNINCVNETCQCDVISFYFSNVTQ